MSKGKADKDILAALKGGTSLTAAAETLGDILHKLNTFNVYKTTQYLEKQDDSDENRILDI